MTDEKKGPLDDFDWDAALAEWDKKPGESDASGDKPKPAAPLQRPPTADKPLYRPPMKTMDPAGAQIAAPQVPQKPPPPKPAPPIAKPPIPKPPVSAFGRKGGGLGQLFSRPEMRKASPDEENEAIDVLLEDPIARKRFRAEDDDEGVVTSAVDVETIDSDIDDKPIVADTHDAGDGEMFDPFSEPPRAKDVPTVHPPPMMDDVGEVRPPQQTSPAFDDIIPEAAVPSSSPARAPVIEQSEEPRVQSITSEAEDVSEFEAPKLPSVAPLAVAAIEDERPAAEWLDGETLAALRDRAMWLEDEAHNVVDKIGSAKCLLACSELRAIVGDADDALRLADEAKSLAPHLPLAARQMRGIGPRDPSAVIESLDDELRRQLSPAAKLHAMIYAAQATSVLGDADGAAKRYDAAARLAPDDARVVLVRAMRAIAKGELTNATLKIESAPSLATLATAVASVLRARGVDSGASDGGGGALDTLGRARAALEKGDVAGAVD